MESTESILAQYRQTSDLDAAVTSGDQNPGISSYAEYLYLKAFARQSFFDEEICRDHLRILWTAFCLHHELLVDTSSYDTLLQKLWDVLSEIGDGTSEWDGFDGFDNFMCKYLV